MHFRDREISNRELLCWVFGGIVVLAAIAVIGFYALQMHKVDAEIHAQSEIQKTQIKEKAAIQRTRERMHWVPWYGDKKNEADAEIAEPK